MTSSQDGGKLDHCASSHNQKRDNNKFKYKKQPELPENRTVWKSNTLRVKEETFIQTSRRSGDGQPRQRGHMARLWLMDRAGEAEAGGQGSPTFVCGKTGRNNWGARQTVQPRIPVQETKASKPPAVKTYGGCRSGRSSQSHRRVLWRDP